MDSKEGVKVEETATAATPADGSANATNGAAAASHADTTADAADEDFEEGYEEEGFEEEGMEYAEEEGYENEFAINASESETRDFDDGLEGQVGSVDWLIDWWIDWPGDLIRFVYISCLDSDRSFILVISCFFGFPSNYFNIFRYYKILIFFVENR